MKLFNQKRVSILISAFFISLISFFIIYQIISSNKNEKLLSQRQVIQEAKAHFQSMVDARSWNAQYGGVFVKASSGLKPNPYLKNNVLLSDKNETLIKINPAWMTRQISEISNKQGTYHFKITSLLPLNPSNKADAFETRALKYFENNRDEKYFYNFDKNSEKFDFMGVLITKQACLKCHDHQGYELGDVRGGIRVSIPTKIHNQQMSALQKKTRHGIITVSIIALSLASVIAWLINVLYRRRYEIEHANEILETKVKERTRDLETVVSHEQHLKDVLKITTEVNEMLITSYSATTILKNATQKLSTNKAYSLVVSGLIHDDILEIISKSNPTCSLVNQDVISIKKGAKLNFLFDCVYKATKLKHAIIEKVSAEFIDENANRRKSDAEHKWMIALPLLHGFENEAYGVITVFCSREAGFELEEMKILENLAHDISIALYSHKQRDSILAMEKEKTANYEETILAFVNIIEQRDTYTAGHTIRVAEYCALIAKGMGCGKDEIHRLEKAAILHDIGKVATPDTILLKPGNLSHLEYELIKQHAEVGADMLEKITIYKDLAEIIRYHHSRYDGKGYPQTSSPDDIPQLSHIMIVADAFDAMTTNRIYRPRKNVAQALEELKRSSGTQFHPEVIKIALKTLKNISVSATSQMPSSELEKRRMSYFFQDGLTELYNEDYLITILNSANHAYKSLHLIDLKGFTKYNQDNGWEEGNVFLKNFAKFLRKTFPDSMIIRYQGDDFIILNRTNQDIKIEKVYQYDALKRSAIKIKTSHQRISEYFSFEEFKKLTDNLK